jgi:S-adenosyl methyltransferase
MTSGEAPVPDGRSTAGAGCPPAFDTSVASQARMYDYLLGGQDNYAADREAVAQALKIWPEMPFTARANRAFLGRAVGYLAREAGVRQFLDIGTGIPTAGNTHQVAQAIAPGTRVVYVDYDPVVLAHARALLTSHEQGATAYIDADLRDTGVILSRASQLLDLTQPVAVTLIAILNAIPDSDDPHSIVATIMDAVPSGSYLALTHLASDLLGREAQDGLEDMQGERMRMRFTSRDRGQVARFFEGTELVEPGLVRVEEWRPNPAASGAGRSSLWCGVGRKR